MRSSSQTYARTLNCRHIHISYNSLLKKVRHHIAPFRGYQANMVTNIVLLQEFLKESREKEATTVDSQNSDLNVIKKSIVFQTQIGNRI